ncbi:MAG: TonB-dependent receptor [Acidobacteria bacterium]|nr:TonB-dependent receptor [Acidobacteriota bacterium]
MGGKHTRLRPFELVVLLALACTGAAARASAQTLDRGEIFGTIRDQSGAVVPGVTVTIREIDTGFERVVVTNDAGQYRGVLLPVGSYTVGADLEGFAPVRTAVVRLAVGNALMLNLVMPVAGIAAAVDVPAVAANAAAAGVGTVVGDESIARLPIDGRDYRDFALLAPTARAITGTRGTFRIGGQPGDYLALHVDGADFTNNFFGELFGSIETRNFSLPLEAVRELHVSAGGFGAASGRSTGGLVNVVTKSGTNTRHGSGAYFLRHHSLAADDAFGNPPAGLVRHQIAGSLGGPIILNRTFYFVAADLQRQTTPITVRFGRNVGGVAVPELGIPDLGAVEGQYGREEDVTAALGKIDHALGAGQQLSVRANFTRHDGTNIAGGPPILSRAPDNLETFTDQGVSVVPSLAASWGPRVLAEAKFQFAAELRPRRAQGGGPQVTISDTGTFGGSQVLPGTQDMYRYQASANVHHLRGRHRFTAGADYNAFNMRNNSFALALRGAYTFPTLERFVARQPSLYAQYFGLGGATAEQAARLDSFWQSEVAFYVQDEWQPGSRLTVTSGLRYDAQLNPTPLAGTAGAAVPVGPPRRSGNTAELTFAPVPQDIPDDTNNWAPRFEAAYDLTGNGETLLKGATGLFYGRTPMIYFPVRGSGVTSSTIVAPAAAFGVTFPEVLPSTIVPGSPLELLIPRPSIQYVDPGFQDPRVLHVSASITRALTSDWSIQAGYLFSDSRNLRIGGFRSTLWDRNLRPPEAVDEFRRGVNILAAGRPDPAIGQANALASFGRGRYHAMIVDVRKTLSRGWALDANYTLSHSTGNASTERDTEALLGPSDPFDLERDYGINELDERHALKAWLHAALPAGIVLGSIWRAGSGLAFPVYSSADSNGDGVTNGGLHPDRPVVDGRLLPRFPFHQPSWFVWDVRAARGFALPGGAPWQMIVEVFNVLGSNNTFSDPRTNATWGQVNFRDRKRTLGPRIAQLGMRLEF